MLHRSHASSEMGSFGENEGVTEATSGDGAITAFEENRIH